eukprot:PhM_4_TR18609/c0_g1_i1/m.30954/K06269/PPP1C; serine/threonine-protein phosphatase PP1 catalytic subunit
MGDDNIFFRIKHEYYVRKPIHTRGIMLLGLNSDCIKAVVNLLDDGVLQCFDVPMDICLHLLDIMVSSYPHAVRILQHLAPLVFSPLSSSERVVAGLRQLDRDDLNLMLSDVRNVIAAESAALSLTSSASRPLCVVGRFAGDLFTLWYVFTNQNWKLLVSEEDGTSMLEPGHRLLFLGNMSGRHNHSLVATLLLFSMKLLFPDHIYLVRGHLECAHYSRLYGFYFQCKTRLTHRGIHTWKDCVQTFNVMPIVAVVRLLRCGADDDSEDGEAVVSKRVLCVPVGLCSELLPTFSSFEKKEVDNRLTIEQRLQRRVARGYVRPCDIEDSGLTHGIMWNQFNDDDCTEYDREDDLPLFLDDGDGRVTFSDRAVDAICDEYNLDCVVCSQNLLDEPHTVLCRGRLRNIVSVANFVGVMGNNAAVLVFRADIDVDSWTGQTSKS